MNEYFLYENVKNDGKCTSTPKRTWLLSDLRATFSNQSRYIQHGNAFILVCCTTLSYFYPDDTFAQNDKNEATADQ